MKMMVDPLSHQCWVSEALHRKFASYAWHDGMNAIIQGLCRIVQQLSCPPSLRGAALDSGTRNNFWNRTSYSGSATWNNTKFGLNSLIFDFQTAKLNPPCQIFEICSYICDQWHEKPHYTKFGLNWLNFNFLVHHIEFAIFDFGNLTSNS